jgi:hypothetical protein
LKTFEDEVGTRMCQWFNKPKERNVLGALAKSKTYIFGKIGALDFFATIAAATLLYVGGHFFARKQEEKYEQKVQRKGSAPTTHLDAVESAVPVMMGAQTPALHVEGERHHEGRALAEPMAATQR